MSQQQRGAVAAGHPVTAAAAVEILRDGGNAFDAIIAAHFTACVVEPVLASLGGGGYLLARARDREPEIFDFFVQTPGSNRLEGTPDFYPIQADFGTVTQEFHIGLGSVAVPGSIRGMFEIHRHHGTLPMTRLVQPAVAAARDGVRFNRLQAYIFDIVKPIYSALPATADNYRAEGRQATDPRLVEEGDLLQQPALANAIEALAREGDALFYRGEIAARIARLCRDGGGYLGLADLESYRVLRRQPLAIPYRHGRFFTNSPPASGGLLIAFALQLLEQWRLADFGFGSARHLDLLAGIMAATNQARLELLSGAGDQDDMLSLLDSRHLQAYRQVVRDHARCNRGTTHISVMDAAGNAAAMTVSNGEGCGHLVPGTGIMLNNMLGEEDINPAGFHCWQPGQRMTSMMSPGLLLMDNGIQVALGSGGSNRIRTAILQVISNLVDFGMSPEQAVAAPRVHCENDNLNIEPGFPQSVLEQLASAYPVHHVWQQQNLFFGGVHSVEWDGTRFHGVGDPRRGGVGAVA